MGKEKAILMARNSSVGRYIFVRIGPTMIIAQSDTWVKKKQYSWQEIAPLEGTFLFALDQL